MSYGGNLTEEELKLLKDIQLFEARTPKEDLHLRKKLTVEARMKIAKAIQQEYSMLKNKKGIFDAQMFSAMEEYLKKCNSTGYRFDGL